MRDSPGLRGSSLADGFGGAVLGQARAGEAHGQALCRRRNSLETTETRQGPAFCGWLPSASRTSTAMAMMPAMVSSRSRLACEETVAVLSARPTRG